MVIIGLASPGLREANAISDPSGPCIARRYHIRGIIEPFVGFRSHSERSFLPIDTGISRRNRCIDSAAAGINATSRSRIIVCGSTYTIDTIFYGVYTRHTRVSKASCCCCCWMHAPTGIRDVQARKRICQDFRDCSKCASRFRILIAPICSLSWCFTCMYRIYACAETYDDVLTRCVCCQQ